MLEIYLKLLPIFGWFALGVILRRCRLVNEIHGTRLLRIMFFITLPALILVNISEAELALAKVRLPLMNISINLFCLGVMFLFTAKSKIERHVLGVMLVCSMITNNFFMFPFIHTVLGEAALVDAIIFDIGNAFSTMTVAYMLAFRYGPEPLKTRNMIVNVCKLPALWALGIALYMNMHDFHFPQVVLGVLGPFGLLTNPLILLALGIFFHLKLKHPRLVLLTVATRMLVGLVAGLGLVVFFNLEGTSAAVVILCGSAPIGFNGLTFPSLAKLDMAFASSAVSLSILIGLFTIPLLLYILQLTLHL